MPLLPLLVLAAADPEVPVRWRDAAAVVEQGLARRVFPGAVVVVGRADSVLFAHGFGRLDWSRTASRPDPETTQFDLASLTKVVATASSAMTLVADGRLDIEAPVQRYLPAFAGAGKERVTVRMLLEHTSGLPAFVAFYRTTSSRDAVVAALLDVPLRRTPGTAVEYSDLNGMLMGQVIEAITGTRLDRYADRAVFRPLGMVHTTFAVADRTHAAPSLVRNGRPAPGVASDPNARAMGGIAGHAGLFASGLDLGRFAQAWMHGGPAGRSNQWVDDATVARFRETRLGKAGRALGWDVPKLDALAESPFGTLATPTTLGHTGWSGTFLWLDPARDLFLVFLTNRSLGQSNSASLRAMRDVRHRLSDAVRRAAGCPGAGVLTAGCAGG